MSSLRYHSQGTDNWMASSRPMDPEFRRMKYGKIQPMEDPDKRSIFALFTRR